MKVGRAWIMSKNFFDKRETTNDKREATNDKRLTKIVRIISRLLSPVSRLSFVVSRFLLRPAHRVIRILDIERIDRKLQRMKRIYHNR